MVNSDNNLVINSSIKRREIKSFVLRQGKITQGQRLALAALLPLYGIAYQAQAINLNEVFARDNPKFIEIGFGMGLATWQIAKVNPNQDYLGIEVHSPGVGSLLMHIQAHGLTNLKVINHDAAEILQHMLMDNSIAGFHIFFPDPWHKKRHHKRRLIQAPLLELLVRKLQLGGYIHLATDWHDYAMWMLDLLRQNQQLINQSITNDFVPRPEYRPLTKFEQRGINLGHGVWDLVFVKK